MKRVEKNRVRRNRLGLSSQLISLVGLFYLFICIPRFDRSSISLMPLSRVLKTALLEDVGAKSPEMLRGRQLQVFIR